MKGIYLSEISALSQSGGMAIPPFRLTAGNYINNPFTVDKLPNAVKKLKLRKTAELDDTHIEFTTLRKTTLALSYSAAEYVYIEKIDVAVPEICIIITA